MTLHPDLALVPDRIVITHILIILEIGMRIESILLVQSDLYNRRRDRGAFNPNHSERYRSRSNSYDESKRRTSSGFDYEDGDQEGFAVDLSEHVNQRQRFDFACFFIA